MSFNAVKTATHGRATVARSRVLVYLGAAIAATAAAFFIAQQGRQTAASGGPGVDVVGEVNPNPGSRVQAPPDFRPAPEEAGPEREGAPTDPGAAKAGANPDTASASVTADDPVQWTAPSRAAAWDYPADLVAQLSEHLDRGLAPEDGIAILDILDALAAEGEAAIPAIRELLASGTDVPFEGVEGLDADGSLRLALFDVLAQIAGFEAEAALVDELQVTASPKEVSALARILEDLAPGLYVGQVVGTARGILRKIDADRAASGDVGPLFEVLHDYGKAEVVPDLQEYSKKWSHYATIALGELPGGEGIPVLVERVERRLGQGGDIPSHSSAIYSDEGLFALQMLAQVAADQPEARAALIEQAAAGRIADVLWPKLAQALAGVYLFETTRRDVESVSGVDSEETYAHVRLSNEQVLYIRNRFAADELTAEEREERIAMIDAVMAATKSPMAWAELEKARDALLKGRW